MNLKKFLLTTFAAIRVLTADNTASNIYQLIAQENLKSLTALEKPSNGFCSSISDIRNRGYDKVAQDKFDQQLHLKPAERRRLVFNILTSYENETAMQDIIDFNSMQDLEILCGPRSNPSLYLASCLDRTVTEVGRINLYRKLIQPTNNPKQLLDQQAIIKIFLSNQDLYQQLSEQLSILQPAENMVLSLWDNEDLFNFHATQSKISIPIEKLKSVEHWLNISPAVIQIRETCLGIFGLATTVSIFYNSAGLAVYALTGKSITNKFTPNISSLIGNWCQSIDQSNGTRFVVGASAIAFCYLLAYLVKCGIKTGITFDRCIHSRLQYIATYLNTAQTLTRLIAQYPELLDKLPAVQKFKSTLDTLSTNKELQLLLTLLASKTITGSYSFFNYSGRIQVAYFLLLQHKNLLLESMQVIGEIDAQLSITKLYKEFQNQRVTMCFPTYLDQQEKPSIKITNFWNPLIDSKTVVPSSLSIGNAQPQNIIITGPNASGKSTITKALLISIIMAQSLGIAPAQKLNFTPFSKIITYLNITDDIAAANSHFKAGVLRARQVVETMQNLKNQEFGLTALDEVFNGTTFVEGQAAAYSLFDMLGNNRNSICVTCTHFPLIPQLEQTGNFANYKVSVIEEPDKQLYYPFTLEQGTSNQIITLKVLQEEGFGDKFLKQAQQLIAKHKANYAIF